MSSPFNHALCLACYAALEPGRVPVRVEPSERETCCSCGKLTCSGIYYRAEPDRLPCGGRHTLNIFTGRGT